MRDKSVWIRFLVLAVATVFVSCVVVESVAWARAGGGGSTGSRGSRGFSTPSRPSSPSPSSPGMGSRPSDPYSRQQPGMSSPSSGFFSRSPFMQGLAGGVLGGFVGNMLFGGSGHATAPGAAPGATTGGGIGLMDIILIGGLLYFLMKYLKRRREQAAATASSGQFPPDSRWNPQTTRLLPGNRFPMREGNPRSRSWIGDCSRSGLSTKASMKPISRKPLRTFSFAFRRPG